MHHQKIYVSDLDGTLLRSNATLSDYSRGALVDLLAAGVHFTVASARTWQEITPILGDIPFELPIIAVNGAYITEYATGHHMVINHIENDFASAVCQHILDADLSPFIVTHNGTEDCLHWQDLKNEEMQYYHDTLHVQKDKRIRRTADLHQALNEMVIAFAVLGPQAKLAELEVMLAETYPGLLENFLFENPYSPGHWWLTIHDQQVCKSKAIRTLVEMTGHRIENLTVFGDHINDIQMLKMAGHGVTVANAEPDVKAVADEVIGSNAEDSVVKYILKQANLSA